MKIDSCILKNKLCEYAACVTEIRRLSAVYIRDISDANEYSEILRENYDKIGVIGKNTRDILSEYLFPIIRSADDISHEIILVLQEFCNLLLDSSNGDELDLFLLFEISDRLLNELRRVDICDEYAAQINIHISVCYNVVNRTARLSGNRKINTFYRDEGLKAAELAKDLIRKDNFVKLGELGKIEAVRAVKFYSALYDTYFAEERTNIIRYKALEDAIRLASDDFYTEQLKNYSWNKHVFRCLEHMGQLTERGNRWNISQDQCREICKHLEILEELWENGNSDVSKDIPESHYRLILLRNRYYAGLSDKDSYQKSLLELYKRFSNLEYDMYSVQMNLLIPAEYIATLEKDNLSRGEIDVLKEIYSRIVFYALNSVNMDAFNYLQEYLIGFLEEFIELEGIMNFETMALQCLAALHPPTYVHCIQVADITAILTKHMLDVNPQKFIGVLGCNDVSEVAQKKDVILHYAYHSGLCHDIGKLTEIDTIFTYGRSLNDSEFEIIRFHTLIGKAFLEKYPSTVAYAKAAECHHRWWNGNGGYPEGCGIIDAISGIIRVADCIDAATDSIGRSYSKGKKLEEVIDEIINDVPGKYMPEAARLLSDSKVISELRYALSDGRIRNYRYTYVILHEAEERINNIQLPGAEKVLSF